MKDKKTAEQKMQEDLPSSPGGRVGHFSIAQLHIKAANTEYDYQLPRGCKRFKLQERNSHEIRFTDTPGIIAAKEQDNYWILKEGARQKPWVEDNLDIQDENMILYFAAPNGNRYVQIIVGF